MRSIWNGAISLGLVTIPVRVYSATEQRDASFHQMHDADGGRIRYKRVCSVCGDEIPYAQIAKGLELASGEVVMLTEADLADVPLPTSRVIEVVQFMPADQMDPVQLARSYYLEPEPSGTKPYVLLRVALERSDKVAIVKLALRQRESLAALRVRDDVLMLETMLWPDEIRTPDFDFRGHNIEVGSQELEMADSLIEMMTADFNPSHHHDAYRDALNAIVEAKVEGRQVVRPGTPLPHGDLLTALRASVETARRSREPTDDEGPPP